MTTLKLHIGFVASAGLLAATIATASSHREAPAISKQAFADNTDTYVFVSPENNNNIVLAASWIPFEAADGGPNYFEWDDRYAYYIHVDNDGDSVADLSFRLTSQTTVSNDQTFLYNTGPITTNTSANWNRYQTVTVVEEVSGTTFLSDARTAPVNIGGKSTPDYEALFQEAVHINGDVKIFAGQTDDAFFVDLQVFDLLTLRGQDAPIGYSDNGNRAVDSLAGFNVHSLVIELPITDVTDADPIIGVWSTTELLSDSSQVSRLGMPLVNEVVFPLAIKDAFNTISPTDDLNIYFAANLQKSVEDPEIGQLLCGLYGVPLPGAAGGCSTAFTPGTARSGRGDIFDIYLQGMVLANPFTINTAGGPVQLPAGFNVNRPDGVRPAEMIRINTAISGNTCSPTPSRLGILGGDACGFPNGRRLTDDVLEISLLAVAGAAYEVLDDRDTSFSFNGDFIPLLSDNIDSNDNAFRESFPYFAAPNSGKQRVYQNPKSDVVTNINSGGGGAVGPALLLLFVGGLGLRLVTRRRA